MKDPIETIKQFMAKAKRATEFNRRALRRTYEVHPFENDTQRSMCRINLTGSAWSYA